ncbi:hypothetical protein, partial [Staphylococcus haemolyticus]|uniref:hypothetical protein n=1 Tax=Staphylococcus haemolyticus TaxID=1283 RepID=UPI001F0A7485
MVLILGIKKETFRSQYRLIASIRFAWQRPTLAERKSATTGAKELTLLRDKRLHPSLFSKIACSFSSTKLASQFSQFIGFKR